MVFNSRNVTAALLASLLVPQVWADVTNDRDFLIGLVPTGAIDTLGEAEGTPSAGIPVGTANDSLFPGAVGQVGGLIDHSGPGKTGSGALQQTTVLQLAGFGDTQESGGDGDTTLLPVYSTGSVSTWAASFDGSDDVLVSKYGFNRPDSFWDNNEFFGDTNGDSLYFHNYQGLTNRGTQLWAKPNGGTQDQRQVLIMDTHEYGGITISASNTWSMAYDVDDVEAGNVEGFEFDSGVAVDFDQWSHLMTRTLTGTTNNVLYVNGVAVAISRTEDANYGYDNQYDTNVNPGENAAEGLAVGADFESDPETGDFVSFHDYYDGDMDELTLFTWGDNSGQEAANGQLGDNRGAFNLGADNAYIAEQLDGVVMGDINLDGDVDEEDAAVFSTNWLSEKVLMGMNVGDWETRQNGDLNFDGIINLQDWNVFVDGFLAANPGSQVPALTIVPEPTSLALLGLGGLAMLRRRRA